MTIGQWQYRIVDKDGNEVEFLGEERRSIVDDSRVWHNRSYPESKPHRIQRRPANPPWEDA